MGSARIVDVLRTGCRWRVLPREYPPWPAVYAYHRRWRMAGVCEQVNAHLLAAVRARDGRHGSPSAAAIASQSASTKEEGRAAVAATTAPRSWRRASATP